MLNMLYPLQTGQANGDRGRLVNFFTLKSANYFGNTNRFTDENGKQIYPSDYRIDNATGYGWKGNPLAAAQWLTAKANAAATTVTLASGIVLTGFFMPNESEQNDILNKGTSAGFLAYSPFGLSGSIQLWMDTELAGSNTMAYLCNSATAIVASPSSKTFAGSKQTLPCRVHFK